MNPITSTIAGPSGYATRLNLAEVNKLRPTVVDEWLINPFSDCACHHQTLLSAHTLADMPGITPVEDVLRHYSHTLCLALLVEGPNGPWTAEQLVTGHGHGRKLITHPVLLDDDDQARRVAHSLVPDVTVGALPAFPATSAEVATWRLAITVAVWRALRYAHHLAPQAPAPVIGHG